MGKYILSIYILLGVSLFSDIIPFSESNMSIGELNNSVFWSKIVKGDVTYYTYKAKERVPILCFHKISDDFRYGLTANKFEDFLIYLNSKKFFLITDKDFINRDFSTVPSGYRPIIMGSDDASEGNFLYETLDSSKSGELILVDGEPVISENTMVSLLNKHIEPIDGKINFTFYVAFKGMPFRQTGGAVGSGANYRGYDILNKKFSYLLDNYYLGIHTITHPVTKNTSADDFKWELEEFYSVMESYVGDRISLIDTLAYPHGCAVLKPEMKSMIEDFVYKNVKIKGGFDFDGYFSHNPFHLTINDLDVSRLGVDNKNIDRVYGFLETIPLFKSRRVIVVKNKSDVASIDYNSDDLVLVDDSES